MILQFRVLGRLYSSVLGALCVDGVVARLKSFRRLSCLGDHFTTRMATPFTSFRALKTDLSSPYFPCILCEDLFTVSLYGHPSLPLSFYLPLPPPFSLLGTQIYFPVFLLPSFLCTLTSPSLGCKRRPEALSGEALEDGGGTHGVTCR